MTPAAEALRQELWSFVYETHAPRLAKDYADRFRGIGLTEDAAHDAALSGGIDAMSRVNLTNRPNQCFAYVRMRMRGAMIDAIRKHTGRGDRRTSERVAATLWSFDSMNERRGDRIAFVEPEPPPDDTLRDRWEIKGYTGRSLARAVGISPRRIYSAGHQPRFRPETAARLRELLDLSPTDPRVQDADPPEKPLCLKDHQQAIVVRCPKTGEILRTWGI